MKSIAAESIEALEGLRRDACVCTIGIFDGMHQGHLRVLHLLHETAARHRVPSTVITFDTHPDLLLGRRHPGLIISLEHRLRLLERNGVDFTLVLPFNEEVRNTKAVRFLDRVIVGALRARAVVLGHDSAFGRNREGNREFLERHAGRCGIEVLAAPEVSVRGQASSS